MYDANPRTHLARAKELFSQVERTDYPRLRYVALDLRLAIETTLQEELTAHYSTYSEAFANLWRAKDFVVEIREQCPDFEIKSRLIPIVARATGKLPKYKPLDLEQLCAIYRELNGHLHHLNRYDRSKASDDRAASLYAVLEKAINELQALQTRTRVSLLLYGKDERFFQDVLAGSRSFKDFQRHIETGHLKEYGFKKAHRLQENVSVS